MKVHGNTTPGLGGPHYEHGSQTDLDWSVAAAGNDFTPGKTKRALSDFCIAKYEMKLRHEDASTDDGLLDDIVADPEPSITDGTYNFETDHATVAEKAKYLPLSVPQGKPWVEIKSGLHNTTGAFQACQLLGTGFKLISNAQWQTVARAIETHEENWNKTNTDATAHYINRGHQDKTPGEALPADVTGELDDDPCVGTEQTQCADKQSTDYDQKRTHFTAASTEAIWDLSGNVWEFVSDLNHRESGYGESGAFIWDEPHSKALYVGDSADEKAANILQWGPEGDHTSKTENPWGGLGTFYGDDTPGGDNEPETPGGVLRGGRWTFNFTAGVFYANLSIVPETTHAGGGFRCVYAP